jgi:hypothetical protein
MGESSFEAELIKDIRDLFPGCIILKNDANYLQGFPDRLILYKNKWAVLEVKRSQEAPHRINQDYYIRLTNSMSYGSFVYPENRERVLNELQKAFGPIRRARLSFRK